MSALLTPEHNGRPGGGRNRVRIEKPGEFSYVLVDRDCDKVLGTDGTLLTLREAADNPAEVWRFDSEAKAKDEIANQLGEMFRELRILRKRVG